MTYPSFLFVKVLGEIPDQAQGIFTIPSWITLLSVHVYAFFFLFLVPCHSQVQVEYSKMNRTYCCSCCYFKVLSFFMWSCFSSTVIRFDGCEIKSKTVRLKIGNCNALFLPPLLDFQSIICNKWSRGKYNKESRLFTAGEDLKQVEMKIGLNRA